MVNWLRVDDLLSLASYEDDLGRWLHLAAVTREKVRELHFLECRSFQVKNFQWLPRCMSHGFQLEEIEHLFLLKEVGECDY